MRAHVNVQFRHGADTPGAKPALCLIHHTSSINGYAMNEYKQARLSLAAFLH